MPGAQAKMLAEPTLGFEATAPDVQMQWEGGYTAASGEQSLLNV